MLCSRFKQIIFPKSSLNNNVQFRCMIASRIIAKRCLRIEEIFVSIAKKDFRLYDLSSMAALRLILKDMNVRKLWNVWTRSQIFHSVVRRCRRERTVKDVLSRFRQTILRPRRTLLLSATAAFKTRDDDDMPIPCESITDNEIEALLTDLEGVDELSKNTLYCTGCGKRLMIDKKHPGVRYCICKDSQVPEESADGWTPYMEAEDVVIWRKEYKPGQGLYAYKVYGKYKEVRAEDFAAVQIDATYRRAWDVNVAALSVVEAEANGCRDQDVLHWEVLWPKLFANRDYVYIRRHKQFSVNTQYTPHKDRIFQSDTPSESNIDKQMGAERLSVHSNAKRKALEADMRQQSKDSPRTNMLYVIVSKACEHPDVPESKHAIRVSEYWSHMVVKSIDGAGEAGMEFVLTYYDEPAVGGMAGGVAAWATGRAAPTYLTRMRRAASQYTHWKHEQETKGVSIPREQIFDREDKNVVNGLTELCEVSAESRRDQSTQTDAHAQLELCAPDTRDKGVGTSDGNGIKVIPPEREPEKTRENGLIEKTAEDGETKKTTENGEIEKTTEDDEIEKTTGDETNASWWRYMYPFYYFV